MIGTELGLVEADTAAALVSAGMLSVLLFPSAALGMLRGAPSAPAPPAAGGRMNPRAEAQAKAGDAYDARVLEPSPPAVERAAVVRRRPRRARRRDAAGALAGVLR